MAIERIDGTNFDQTTFEREGSGGGGGTLPTGDGNTNQPSNNTFSNIFVFNILSNQSSFTTLLDSIEVGNNKRIRITRDSLSSGPKRIEIKKNGYSSNEYYIVEMVDDDIPIIDNPLIDRPLGISTKDIVLTKYNKNTNNLVGTPKSIKNEISSDLSFTLNKLLGEGEYEEPTLYTSVFNISGLDASVSILKNGNKFAEFFPPIGASEYKDVDGTKYVIRSTDLNLYRITNILYTSNNQEKELIATDGESLELNIILNSDIIFDIITEAVTQPQQGLDPQIELLKTDARTYNLSSEVGVPLMFRKNSDVQAITVIVGDDVLEFDDLDGGDLCGITIPHEVFKKIGKYNIKIFPFSFDDYENQVRPSEKGDIIEPKKVKVKFDIKEEVRIDPPTPEERFNPYTPVSTGGSGGGGSRTPMNMFDEQQNQNDINPFTNRGDFVDRPVDRINYR